MLALVIHNPIFFYSIVLFTSVLSAALGAGGGFILIPLAAIQFGAKEGVGILAIYFLFQNINKIAVFWPHIQWRIALRVILWSLPGVLIGSVALSYVPVLLFKRTLAIVILIYLADDLFKLIPRKRQPDDYLPLLSVFYGFLSGFVGSGNVIKGPLFTSLGLLKQTYVATYAFTSLFMNVPKIMTYYSMGIIDSSALVKSVPFLVISIVGTTIGKRFMNLIRDDVFYYVVTATFALSALALLLE